MILNARQNGKLLRSLKSHTVAVVSLNWEEDGQMTRVCAKLILMDKIMKSLYFIYDLILIYFFKIDVRMSMAATRYMKTVLLVSFHHLQEFRECLDWYLERPVSWMIVKIHFESCQILHSNVLISSAVEIKMDSFALVYLGSFR